MTAGDIVLKCGREPSRGVARHSGARIALHTIALRKKEIGKIFSEYEAAMTSRAHSRDR
jgi:hypothetical protein